MQIQINTDHHLQGSEAREQWASGVVEAAMVHFADSVTRVEAHLSDENAGKGGPAAFRCMMEARINGLAPIAVTSDAASLDAAVDGAMGKLVRASGHAIGRADKHAHESRQLPVGDTTDDDFVPSSEPF